MRKDSKILKSKHKTLTIKAQLKKAHSLDDLFTQDDVNSVLEYITNEKAGIKELIVLYKTSDGKIHWNCTASNKSTVLGVIDIAKDMILRDDDEDE